MKKIVGLALMAIITLAVALPSKGAGRRPAQGNAPRGDFEDPDIFIETVISQDNLYAGVPFCFSVMLYTTDPSIAFCETVKEPTFGSMKGRDIINYSTAGRFSREIVNGRTYYVCTLHIFELQPPTSGTYVLRGGDYLLSVNQYEYYNDPFWGLQQRIVPAEYPVQAKDIKVKVNNLPKAPKDFSGAAGEFNIRTSLERPGTYGDGYQHLYIEISGQGSLEDSHIPSLMDQFPSTLGIKSITTRSSNSWYENGVIRSSIIYECVFAPVETGRVVIPSLKFNYFNTLQKKYVTSESAPIEMDVEEEESLPGSRPIYQEI